MTTQFAMDLRLARRKSGLSQEAVAELLGVRQSTISQLEQGKFRPSLKQVVDLSIVYDRSFESYFRLLTRERQPIIWHRLKQLPDHILRSAISSSGNGALRRLKRRLQGSLRDDE